VASPLAWVRQYGAAQLGTSTQTLGFGREAATGLTADSGGNVIVAGYVAGSFAGFSGDPGVIDAYLTKYAPDGTRLWLQQFPSPGGALPGGVAADAANNIVAVGSAFTTGGAARIFAVKLDPLGKPLWYVSLPAAAGPSFGEQVRVEADGSIIVAGFGFFAGSSQETLFAARLSGADGHLLWTTTELLPAIGLLTGMALDAAGNPLLVGVVSDHGTDFYPCVIKLNQAAGTIAWVHQIASTPNSMIPFGVASDAAGNVLVGGGAYAGTLTFGFTADPKESAVIYKFNAADGAEVWQKKYSTGKGDSITSLQTLANGTIYAAGYSNGHFDSYDPDPANTVFLLTLASDGTLNAAHQFGTGPLLNASVPFGPLTAIDPAGNLFVSGPTTNAYPGFSNDAHTLQMFVARMAPGGY
jgi:outer membrane protein assembly factor BamB